MRHPEVLMLTSRQEDGDGKEGEEAREGNPESESSDY